MLETALHTSNLRDKIRISTDAATLDNRYVDPLIVRGQTYLLLVSLAFSQQAQAMDYADYLDKARIDFDRAITLDAKNVWAWIGNGDVLTWLKLLDEAPLASPSSAYTRHKRASRRTPNLGIMRWPRSRNSSIPKLLKVWIPYQKEAYAMRSEIYLNLNQPEQAIEDLSTVIRVDPTNAAALVTRAKLYRDRLQGRLAKDDLERACVLGTIPACEQLP